EEQHVDRIRVPGMGIGDHHMHHSMRGDGRLPGEGLVYARRPAIGIHKKVFRPAWKAEVRSGERLVGAKMLRTAMRRGMRRNRFRIGWLEAEAAGTIHRAYQHLQEVQSPRRLEPV